MRRREFYWSLFHLVEKRQLTDLRTDQIESIYEAVPVKDRKDWVIWREGFRSWKHFSDFPDLLLSLRSAQTHSPPSTPQAPPAREPDSGREVDLAATAVVTPDSTTRQMLSGSEAPSLALMQESTTEDRDTRYPRKLEISIFGTDRMFKNSTIDISMHGMQLKDPIPEGLPRYFNVDIFAREKKITVVCSMIKSEDGSPSRRLRIEINDHPDVLLSAILAN